MLGILISGSNNVFDVDCEDGVVRSCSIKGKKLKTDGSFYNPLCPGDMLAVEADELTPSKGQITALVPRKNCFVRWNVKGRCAQILASNIDLLFCVITPAQPPFRARFVDRVLAQAELNEVRVLIVCNKCDLKESGQENINDCLTQWEAVGYKTLKVSALTGEGLKELAREAENKRCVFVGQSGVGKSSLINALSEDCFLKTGALSEKYGKGSHTTVKGTLLRVRLKSAFTGGKKNACASFIDTPGVRRFVLSGIEEENLALYFKEMKNLVGSCAFGMSCTHTQEEGCKIRQAVQNGAICSRRYESWQRIKEELKTGNWAD